MSNQQLTPRINRHEPNVVIDGGMEIWPEGTSRSIANNVSLYGSVLMKGVNSATGVTVTNSQQASAPVGTNLNSSNQISKSAAGSLAANTLVGWQYAVEGYDIDKIINDEFTVLFWVKSSVASTRGMSAQNASASHAYVQQYTVNAINTWELKALKVPALNTCPGTLERTTNIGLHLIFPIVAGSNYHTASLSQWVAGPKFTGMGDDTTWVTGTAHDHNITGLIVLPGDWTALQSNPLLYRFIRAGRNFPHEVVLSQRYFEKSVNAANAVNTINDAINIFPNSNNFTTSAIHGPFFFKVSKRANPTIVTYDAAGNTGRYSTLAGGGAATNNLIPGDYFIRENFWSLQVGAVGAHAGIVVNYVADARF